MPLFDLLSKPPETKKGYLSKLIDKELSISKDLSPDEARPISSNISKPSSSQDTENYNQDISSSNDNKKSWLSNAWDKVKDSFGTKVEVNKDKEGNLTEVPKIKEGIGHKILRYALPALMSFSAGQGIAPGLFSGMLGSYGMKKGYKEDVTDFNKEMLSKQAKKAELARKLAEDQREAEQFNITTALKKRGQDIYASKGKEPAITITEKTAFAQISPKLKEKLKTASLEELADAMTSSDPQAAAAASYLYKIKTKNTKKIDWYPEDL